jgi:hypothetical protein
MIDFLYGMIGVKWKNLREKFIQVVRRVRIPATGKSLSCQTGRKGFESVDEEMNESFCLQPELSGSKKGRGFPVR